MDVSARCSYDNISSWVPWVRVDLAHRVPRILDLLSLSPQASQNIRALLLGLERNPLALHEPSGAIL